MASVNRPLPIQPVEPHRVLGAGRYLNRELSWLAFNTRVLEEAMNPAHPLLERLRFLSISGNNFDEFTMVRVAGLRGQVDEGIETPSPDGLTPAQQLAEIAVAAERLMTEQQQVFGVLRKALRSADFAILDHEELGKAEAEWLESHFLDQIFPVLTPQAIDPAHPFPFIPNKGFSLVFDMKRLADGERLNALLMLPQMLPRFVRLPGKSARYLAMEQVLTRFFGLIFPGFERLGQGSFRIIRDSDIEIEEEAEDLVRFYQTAIKRRRRGQVIRLKIEEHTPRRLRTAVKQALAVNDRDVMVVDGILGIADLAGLVDEDRPDL